MSSAAAPLDLGDEAVRDALAGWLAAVAGAERASIGDTTPLTGGAIHQHWRINVAFEGGPHGGDPIAIVLRAEGDARLEESHSVAEEFTIARAAFEAGVAVPEPLWQADDSVLGRAFSISRFVEGVAAGHLLVRDETLGGPRPALLEQLGAELARIQTLEPGTAGLEWLPTPEPSPALAAVAEYRAALDAHPKPRPAMEWGLRWLEREAPRTDRLVLVHSDYRTGNFLVGEGGLHGVLDWEFARWGDPLDDAGWFSARCWRFNRYDRRAGGLGDLADFERGYGRELPPRALHYWEVMAHVRWAVIAIHQGERHSSGRQPSLELALTGRIVDEIEVEILTLIEEGERGEYGSGADATPSPPGGRGGVSRIRSPRRRGAARSRARRADGRARAARAGRAALRAAHGRQRDGHRRARTGSRRGARTTRPCRPRRHRGRTGCCRRGRARRTARRRGAPRWRHPRGPLRRRPGAGRPRRLAAHPSARRDADQQPALPRAPRVRVGARLRPD